MFFRYCLFILFLQIEGVLLAFGTKDSTNIAGFLSNPKYIPYALVDLYYTNTLRRSDNSYHSPLFQNYNSLGQVAVNQIILGFLVNSPRYSAHFGFHAGTYLRDAYSQEPVFLRYIRYADIGIALMKSGNLWLNMGILKSRYGLESPVPHDNWTLTYPIISGQSPFYQTGARLEWSGWKNWNIALWILNGWGRIQRISNNPIPSWSLSVAYKQANKFELAYNNFIGNDNPYPQHGIRHFHEIHGTVFMNNHWSLAAMLALGIQYYKSFNTYNYWSGGELVAQYLLNKLWSFAGRMEYFKDRNGVIIDNSKLPMGSFANIYGPALNVDYKMFSHLKLRTELKYLFSPVPVFKYIDNQYFSNRTQVTFAVSWHL